MAFDTSEYPEWLESAPEVPGVDRCAGRASDPLNSPARWHAVDFTSFCAWQLAASTIGTWEVS